MVPHIDKEPLQILYFPNQRVITDVRLKYANVKDDMRAIGDQMSAKSPMMQTTV